MRKIIKLIGVIGVTGWLGVNIIITPIYAFDRTTLFNNIRSNINTNYTYSGINIAINAGPVLTGSTNKNLPAYQQIAQITAQIQQLKEKLKNFSPK